MFLRIWKLRRTRVPPSARWYSFLSRFIRSKAAKAAMVLSRKTENLSQTQVQKMLYVFTAIGILLNVLIIVTAVSEHPATTHFHWGTISRPAGPAVNPVAKVKPGTQYNQWLQLESKLDSLQKTEAGRKQYKLFLQEHPHFTDSLQAVKSLYEDH